MPEPTPQLLLSSAYHYDLPPELIAQEPASPRHNSRLMVVERARGTIRHKVFRQLPELLRRGDCLVLNNSKVMPARLRGRKTTGGKVEILLVRQHDECSWFAMTRPGLKPGQSVDIKGPIKLTCKVEAITADSLRLLRFDRCGDALQVAIYSLGEVPLPPYIHRIPTEPASYQTVYATEEGSIAAPTAGLHFTQELMDHLARAGIERVFITLHVGPGTFLPVKVEEITKHKLYPEWCRITEEAAVRINSARKAGGRIVAVGTTVVRALETASLPDGTVLAHEGYTDLFIYPGYQFKTTDALITNFHLPRSTLLMLVAAFAGYDLTMKAYQAAIRERYRFYSFGDAMLIL